MELKQTQKLTQKFAITPHMKQSLHILQMPLLELKNYIEKEVEENPVIEREAEDSQKITESLEEPLLRTILENEHQQYPTGDYANEISKIKAYHESLITKQKTLHDILTEQLRMRILSNKEYTIGEFIIHYIDENGYLTLSAKEIARFLNDKSVPANGEITHENIERMISVIQSMDPAGVGARNLKECLFIQLRTKNKTGALVYKIVEKYLPDVARNRIRIIAGKLKVSTAKIKSAIKEISRLEPKPGRVYSSPENIGIRHSVPDIIVDKNKANYEIIINSGDTIKFRINPVYKNIIKSGKVSAETKKYIQEKIKAALNIKKAVSRRDETLRKVTRCILNIQKDFFEHGDMALLRPLTLKQVASLVERNESTISRVVNQKYIKTHHGTFKLNLFFTKPVKAEIHSHLSRESIKTYIYDIINEENKKRPLNDSKISSILHKERINIARRTVAKYREELNIPPASRRKSTRSSKHK